LGGIDILCLQEVKILGFMLYTTLSVIWPRHRYFYFDHTKGKGGVNICVPPQLDNSVVGWVMNLANHLVWILLNLYAYILSMANIYSSNDSKEHVRFGHYMDSDLPGTPWLTCGDFNMVESQ
jgi:exonuclease III